MAQQENKYHSVEVQPRATRKTFSAKYKRRILSEADACPRGQVRVLRRREELYLSHLKKWRGERELGTVADRPRGVRPNPEQAQIKRLAHENAALKRKLVGLRAS